MSEVAPTAHSVSLNIHISTQGLRRHMLLHMYGACHSNRLQLNEQAKDKRDCGLIDLLPRHDEIGHPFKVHFDMAQLSESCAGSTHPAFDEVT